MLEDNVTNNVSKYLRDNKVNLTELSRKTGISYGLLYASVGDRSRSRELRANEFMSICKGLHLDPKQFSGR